MSERGRGIGLSLTLSPCVIVVAIVVYGLAVDFKPGTNFGSVLGIGLIAGAASFVVGALLGFLFGLPRTLQQPGSAALLQTNTNLEQISDWLTKILVGIGLVQLGKIGKGINGLAGAVAPGLGGQAGAKQFALGLLVYSGVDGFLVGYMWTRTVVTNRLLEIEAKLAKAQAADTILSSPPPASPPPVPPSPAELAKAAEAVLSSPLPPPPPPPPPSPGDDEPVEPPAPDSQPSHEPPPAGEPPAGESPGPDGEPPAGESPGPDSQPSQEPPPPGDDQPQEP